MNLLIDTHVLPWWLGDDPRLGCAAAARIADPRNLVGVSAASAREIARAGFQPLDVTLDHVLAVRTRPRHHADPFDRLLIAQALTEGLTS